jgi:hypothetical protein
MRAPFMAKRSRGSCRCLGLSGSRDNDTVGCEEGDGGVAVADCVGFAKVTDGGGALIGFDGARAHNLDSLRWRIVSGAR